MQHSHRVPYSICNQADGMTCHSGGCKQRRMMMSHENINPKLQPAEITFVY